MPIYERRQYFRVEDQLYFDYRIIKNGEVYAEQEVIEELLGRSTKPYQEITNYYQDLNNQLIELEQNFSSKEPELANYLNVLNMKLDSIIRHMMVGKKNLLRKVNLSIGGMSFRTKERIEEKTMMKIVIYTQPQIIPIVLDAVVIYSQYQQPHQYRTAVQFVTLSEEHEELLTQHIILAQSRCQSNTN